MPLNKESFWNPSKVPQTIKGIANIEILILVNPTMSHEPALFPRLAPKTIPMPCARVISPAERKEIEIIETKVEDCIKMVVITPKEILLKRVSVDFFRIFSNNPPLKDLKPLLRFVIPISKIATPAKILANSGNTTKK